jgi:RimJ/RimL family protein N-acetyltransferase
LSRARATIGGYGDLTKRTTSEIIGIVDLYRKETPENRGFWLGRMYWGKGLMTEAVFPIMAAYDAKWLYVWWNPVRHGLVEHPDEWPF